MKTNKVAAAALTAAMMMVSAASAGAAGLPAKAPVSQNILNKALDYTVSVNGTSIGEGGYLNKDGKTVMLPLRALGEALGYQVKWNASTKAVELTSGAQWTSVYPGKDQYSFAKMALKLGVAPESIQGKVYVPASFAEQVLISVVEQSGKKINVSQKEEEVKTATTTGTVTHIDIEDGKGRIQINGVNTEGLILNVGPDSKIVNAEGEAIAWSDLLLGMEVEAKHSLAMTMSLPGQTALYELKVKTVTEAKEILGTAGEIEEVMKDEAAGKFSILLKGQGLSEAAPEEVRLNIDEETQIVTMNGEKADEVKLVKGAKVIGFYGPVMTKSLPPITQAWKIVVSE